MDVVMVPPEGAGAFTSRVARSGSWRVYRWCGTDAQLKERREGGKLRNSERIYREGGG